MSRPCILVTFCNRVDSSGRVLAAIGEDGGLYRWFDFSPHTPASACGLAFAGDTLYCACSDERGSYIATFDPGGTLRDYVRLANVGDVHSICVDGSSLFAASTESDELVRLTISRLSAPGEVVWRAGEKRADCNHLNCVTIADGKLYCGGFGPRYGPAWSDAYDGFIYNVSERAFVARGLFHPHSIVAHQGALYFCESAESSLRTLSGALRYVDGYARGLAFRGQTYFVGASRGRRSNALARYVLNPADPGMRSGRCAIYTGSLSGPGEPRTFDLEEAAEEIYDLLAVPEAMYSAI